MRAHETEVNRIAIGPRASSPAGTDAPVRSADVFDDDGLSKRPSHPLGHNSPDHIRGAARSERHDHGDGARRIGLRPCDRARRPGARQHPLPDAEIDGADAVVTRFEPSALPRVPTIDRSWSVACLTAAMLFIDDPPSWLLAGKVTSVPHPPPEACTDATERRAGCVQVFGRRHPRCQPRAPAAGVRKAPRHEIAVGNVGGAATMGISPRAQASMWWNVAATWAILPRGMCVN